MPETLPCHVCQSPTDDACLRCSEPTCAVHLYDQAHLCLCVTCKAEIEAQWAAGGGPLDWPFPVRSPNPAWFPGGVVPAGLEIAGND